MSVFHRRTHRVDYEKCVGDFYLEGEKAVILCRTEELSDVISHYSVYGHENMNAELAAYLDDNIFYIPMVHPIVIRFCGKTYSEEEKEKIRKTLASTYEFKLALAQADLAQNRKYSVITLGIGILFFVLYFLLQKYGAVGVMLSLFFWFFLWEFGSSGWTQNLSLHREVKHMERVAEAEIQFEDENK